MRGEGGVFHAYTMSTDTCVCACALCVCAMCVCVRLMCARFLCVRFVCVQILRAHTQDTGEGFINK
jgi:hypothetical protein